MWGRRVTFCWLDRVFFYVQIRNFAWQSAPPKEFHKQCDAWPEWCFGEFAIKQKWYISPPLIHLYTFCYFNMPKLPEGSGDFQGMNELIQLNAVVVSSSVPMRLGWPALDWCKESVCAERSLLSVPRGESHSHSLPFSSYCNPPFLANFHNPWSDSFVMILSNWTITSLRPLPIH